MEPVRLPEDEGLHHFTNVEWWYVSVVLFDGDRLWGQFVAASHLWLGGRATYTRLTPIDGPPSTKSGRHLGSVAPSAWDRFDIRWRDLLTFRGGEGRYVIETPDLTIRTTSEGLGATLQGVQGIYDYGDAEAAWVIWPRLSAKVELADGTLLKGHAWAEHQWGHFDASRSKWKLISIRLTSAGDQCWSALEFTNPSGKTAGGVYSLNSTNAEPVSGQVQFGTQVTVRIAGRGALVCTPEIARNPISLVGTSFTEQLMRVTGNLDNQPVAGWATYEEYPP